MLCKNDFFNFNQPLIMYSASRRCVYFNRATRKKTSWIYYALTGDLGVKEFNIRVYVFEN